MNRAYFNMILLSAIVALLITGVRLGSLPLLALGLIVSSVVIAGEGIVCVVHRYLFAKILKKHGMKLITFNRRNGFTNYGPQPWWKWITGYDGTIALGSGQIIDCWFVVSGPLFATIHPEMICEAMPDDDGTCPIAPIVQL